MRARLSFRSFRSLRPRRLSALLATMGMAAACPDFALARPEPLSIRSTAPPTSTLQDMIAEASRRFGVPASWIAEVMSVESRGHANALSPKGAIGLMQLMPQTYADMRARYGLGANPWDPRDNVLAGAAYLRLLYGRYGVPGFLVAYNAGPGRWDDYRLRGRLLPLETVAYLARLGPVVAGSVPPMAHRRRRGSPSVAARFAAFRAAGEHVDTHSERHRPQPNCADHRRQCLCYRAHGYRLRDPSAFSRCAVSGSVGRRPSYRRCASEHLTNSVIAAGRIAAKTRSSPIALPSDRGNERFRWLPKFD